MHNFYIDLILGVLATWRITSIISQEKIFEPLRRILGEKETTHIAENGFTYTDYEYTTFISKLISCFMCLSVWVGMFNTVMLFVFPYFFLPFALSAMGIFLEQWRVQIH